MAQGLDRLLEELMVRLPNQTNGLAQALDTFLAPVTLFWKTTGQISWSKEEIVGPI